MSDRAYELGPREEECDLVMKGGITSGVVYPGAIRKIAEPLPVPQPRWRLGGRDRGRRRGSVRVPLEPGRAGGIRRAR